MWTKIVRKFRGEKRAKSSSPDLDSIWERINQFEGLLNGEINKIEESNKNFASIWDRIEELISEVPLISDREIKYEKRLTRMERKVRLLKTQLRELRMNSDVFLDIEKRKNQELQQRLQQMWILVREATASQDSKHFALD